MPRKGPAPRRELAPDPIYRSVLVTQVVNKVLVRGKRSLAEHIVGYLLAIATVQTRRVFQDRIGNPYELRPVEFTLVMLLLANPGASPKQLARALRMPAPAMSSVGNVGKSGSTDK